jgi:hypothetical protein
VFPRSRIPSWSIESPKASRAAELITPYTVRASASYFSIGIVKSRRKKSCMVITTIYFAKLLTRDAA